MRHTYYTCDKCGAVMKGKGRQVVFFPICDKAAGFDPEEEIMKAAEYEDLELCEECCSKVFDGINENRK